MTLRRLKRPAVGVHPAITLLHKKMDESPLPLLAVAKRAGFDTKTLRNWWMGRSTPTLQDLEAVFNALGHQLIIEVKDRA